MVNALKRLDKKFIILVGIIVALPIVLIIFLAILQGCGDKKVSYDSYEQKMSLALEKYMKNKGKIPTEEGEILTVELSTLVEGGYIKSPKKLLGDDTCEGSVSVRRNGASIESNNGGFLNYTVDLKCKEYSTVHLVDKLTENLETTEEGLYKIDSEYVYKGNKVKNYISFYGHSYRIMSIDSDGILKLIKAEPEMVTRIWDNKFNVETNRASGKNIYKDSIMLDYLLNDYTNPKKFTKSSKQQIISRDVCVGKRSDNDASIDVAMDCSEVLENQIISLINVSDYARASLDPDCKNLKSLSCNNYNYLYGIASSTWTLNGSSDNTYEVAFLSDGLTYFQNANTYMSYNIVIYIDGNQIYTTGTGSSNDPYVIE